MPWANTPTCHGPCRRGTGNCFDRTEIASGCPHTHTHSPTRWRVRRKASRPSTRFPGGRKNTMGGEQTKAAVVSRLWNDERARKRHLEPPPYTWSRDKFAANRPAGNVRAHRRRCRTSVTSFSSRFVRPPPVPICVCARRGGRRKLMLRALGIFFLGNVTHVDIQCFKFESDE